MARNNAIDGEAVDDEPREFDPSTRLGFRPSLNGVRAAAVSQRGEVTEAVQSIGANLIVINGLQRSPTEIQRIIETFMAMPPQCCPTELKQWLE